MFRIKLQLIFCLIGFFFNFIAHAQTNRYLVMIGGGGEPPGTSTIFDSGLQSLGTYLKANAWVTEILFNDEHSGTNKILEQQFPANQNASLTSLTPRSLQELVQRYEIKIERGEIKKGEQLLLILDSHGAKTDPREITHSIAAGNGEISLDSLTSLSELANKKGISLGILDMSCHSGNSLKLANPHTCVITATGPEHYASNYFYENFVSKIKTGKNLETVFLETRKSLSDPSFPMISTTTGVQLNEQLYPFFSPFLFWSHDGGKLVTYLFEEGNRVGERKEFRTLTTDSLRLYSLIQERVIQQVRSWHLENLKKMKTLPCQLERDQNQYSWGELIQVAKTFVPRKNFILREKVNVQNQLKCLELASGLGNEIINAYPELLNYEKKWKELIEELPDTYNLALNVTAEEAELYDRTYSQESLLHHQDVNPCANFYF